MCMQKYAKVYQCVLVLVWYNVSVHERVHMRVDYMNSIKTKMFIFLKKVIDITALAQWTVECYFLYTVMYILVIIYTYIYNIYIYIYNIDFIICCCQLSLFL